jgi:hypothetical protein
MKLEAVGKGRPILVVLCRTDFPPLFEAKFIPNYHEKDDMLAGVRLAHPYFYSSQADRLTNNWSARNSRNSDYIDDISYGYTLEDTYAFIVDKMSSLEQHVRSRNSLQIWRVDMDL